MALLPLCHMLGITLGRERKTFMKTIALNTLTIEHLPIIFDLFTLPAINY